MSFEEPAVHQTGSGPVRATRGDMDGDGDLDVATGNLDSSVSILLGDGTGSLVPSATVPLEGGASGIEAADVNGDGSLDLLVPSYLDGTVQVLVNDGSGMFTGLPPTPVGPGTSGLIVFDFDDDGDQDIATANFDNRTVAVLFGDGTGSFAPAQLLEVGAGPNAIALVDVDGTPGLDLVTANQFDGSISVLGAQGDGSFGPSTEIPLDFSAFEIEVADVDTDGHPDMVVSHNGEDLISVVYGSAAGVQGEQRTYAVGSGPTAIALNDLNSDGVADIVTGNEDGTVSVLLGTGTRTLGVAQAVQAGGSPSFVTTGDIDADGRNDLITTNVFDDNVVVLRNTGAIESSQSRLVGPSSFLVGTTPVDYEDHPSVSRRLIVRNTGPDVIRTSQMELMDGTGFQVAADTCSNREIPSGNACSALITYTADITEPPMGPVSSDDPSDSASLRLRSNAANGVITVLLLANTEAIPPPPFPEIPDDATTFAIDVSLERYVLDGEAGAVVLSRDDVFADSLSGSVLSSVGPLLFTGGEALDAATRAEIERVLPQGGTVYLLGGPVALSAEIESALIAGGYYVVRLQGASRVETAVAIANEAVSLFGPPDEVAIARAGAPVDNPTAAWADAVAAGGWAADAGQPILLTPTASLHPAVEAWLAVHQATDLAILGGNGAVSAAVESRLGEMTRSAQRVAGPNRYATAAAIADAWGASDSIRVVAPGDSEDGWAYALALAGLADDLDAPVLLTELQRLPPETCAALGQVNSLQTPTARTADAVRTPLSSGC